MSAQGPGNNELPAAFVTPDEVDRAHGVLGGHKHESPKIARQQPIPLLNKPAIRPRRPPIPPQTLLDHQKPRPGHFDDLFRRDGKAGFKFDPRKHGAWVRQRLSAESRARGGRRKKYWVLSPERIATEIELWFKSNQQDLLNAQAWAAKGKIGTFKAKTKIWIIPQHALAAWARDRIWDTAAFFAAAPADRSSIQIDLQDFKITGKAVWNATAFATWGAASSLPDLQGLQEITEAACWLPFQGTMDTVLAPNAMGLYGKMEVAADLSRAEIAEGLLTTPVLGPSLFPIKLVPRNVATVWRNGAIKDRGTADCTVTGDFEEHSPNKGFHIDTDEYHYPSLTFISSSLVAFIGAIIIEAGPEDFTISKCDWSRYYRQLARCESMLWLQGAMTLPSGMTLDRRLIFGNTLGTQHQPSPPFHATEHHIQSSHTRDIRLRRPHVHQATRVGPYLCSYETPQCMSLLVQ